MSESNKQKMRVRNEINDKSDKRERDFGVRSE